MLRRPARRRRRDALALGGWALLITVAVWWGHELLPGGTLNVQAPPFQGHFRLAPRAVVPGLLYAVVAVAVLPRLAARLPWRPLLAVGAGAAAGWAVALAVWDGHLSLGGPIARAHEYLPAVSAVGADPGAFLSSFADDVAHRRLPVHVNGHPPLMVLVFWAWDRVGLGGSGWAAALVIAVGASAVAALAVVLRELGDEQAARRALPFLVLAPFAVTVATSADAFFLGVGAWAAAALAVGLRRRRWPVLLAAGVLVGALPYLSYGLVPFGAVLLVVGVLAVRRGGGPSAGGLAPLVVALSVGLLTVPLAMTLGGFWWLDGVHATHRAWSLGKGDDRPYAYSFVADVAILAVLTGPATAVAATRRPRGAPLALSAAATCAVLTLAVSGVTRLEVERIWLPFAPWVALVTAALPARSRGWLAVNAAVALAFQLLLLDVW